MAMCATVQLPDAVLQAVARAAPDAEIRIAAASDLGAGNRFGECWLVLAGDRVLVCAPDGAEAEILVDLPLKDISEAQVEILVGGAMLQAVVNGHKVDLLPYTNALSQRFGQVRGQLDAAAKGKPIPEEPERRTRCPTCGLVLGEETRVCPRCVRKGAVLRRLLGYARPYRARLVLVSMLMLGAAFFGLVPPYLTKILVDDVLIPRQNAILLAWLVVGLAGSSVLSTVLAIWRSRVGAWVGGRVSFDIRAALYDRLQWLSLRYYDRHPTGAIISRLTQDSGGVQDFLAYGLPWVASNAISVIGVAVAVFIINWKLALLVLIPAPLVSILARVLWRRMRRAFHRFWYRWSRFYAIASDALSRVKIIKAFSQQPTEIERFQLRNADVFDASVYAEQTWATYMPLIGLAVSSGSLLVWYFGGLIILGSGGLTVGGLMAFLAYLAMLYGPLNGITQSAQWMSRALTAAERIFEVLDAEADTEKGRGDVVPESIRGEIEFRGVTFGYEKHQPVLKDISFKAERGQMLGLVGKSGAGKTTVINLLCRFYDADDGEVVVDGVNLRDLDLSFYRGRLGAVLQEPFLFTGTIAENIAYGKPDATIEEIMAAAKVANAHDFIVNKPDGYDEQVGEHGGRLSAGEKQRICIARAILHDPAILILDEATASVDLETEAQIQEAIARLIAGRTTFAIAHRLSTLRNASNLLVLEDGKVAEFGTHEELEAKKGAYHRLLDIHQKTSMTKALDG
ncbi:MAG: ABC transporter ATP-binding protein [Armatimonadota bacterium]|nr:MAG: ABC transporter ATP-binding protein [Armatimonadota bacterium]